MMRVYIISEVEQRIIKCLKENKFLDSLQYCSVTSELSFLAYEKIYQHSFGNFILYLKI